MQIISIRGFWYVTHLSRGTISLVLSVGIQQALRQMNNICPYLFMLQRLQSTAVRKLPILIILSVLIQNRSSFNRLFQSNSLWIIFCIHRWINIGSDKWFPSRISIRQSINKHVRKLDKILPLLCWTHVHRINDSASIHHFDSLICCNICTFDCHPQQQLRPLTLIPPRSLFLEWHSWITWQWIPSRMLPKREQ